MGKKGKDTYLSAANTWIGIAKIVYQYVQKHVQKPTGWKDKAFPAPGL